MSPSDQINAVYAKYRDLPDVTWVGPNSLMQGLILGFDDGSIISTDSNTGGVSKPQQLSPSGDAVNGIAAVSPTSLAVSTRSEVLFFQVDGSGQTSRAVFPGGSHGVVATKSGSYVAPLGPHGLLIVRPTDGKMQKMEVTRETEDRPYFYRVAALHDPVGTETLVFANRKNGVGLSLFNRDERRRVVHTMGFVGIDIVDVCGVASGSLAAFAVSRTGDILWIEDSSKHQDPVVLRPKNIEGSVYRVLATPHHLFLLSSKALYVWFGLVDRASNGEFASPNMIRLVLPMDAIDMSLLGNDYLLLVMGANAVHCLPVKSLESQIVGNFHLEKTSGLTSGSLERATLEDVRQIWQTEDIEQHDLAMV